MGTGLSLLSESKGPQQPGFREQQTGVACQVLAGSLLLTAQRPSVVMAGRGTRLSVTDSSLSEQADHDSSASRGALPLWRDHLGKLLPVKFP